MCPSHVTVMSGVGSKRFSTVTAFEWFFATVLAYVSSQDGGCCKCFTAEGTLVRSLPTVNPEVFIQTGRLRKLLTTFFALVWTMLFVDVKDVDAKTVTFFKRAIA